MKLKMKNLRDHVIIDEKRALYRRFGDILQVGIVYEAKAMP